MPDEPGPIRVEDDRELRVVTIDRPESRNALDVAAAESLGAAVRSATDSDVRAVAITGTPPAFCAGGDLPALAAIASRGEQAATDVIYRHFHGIVRAIRDAPLPVIAVVNGPAVGAGLDLALCCDLRIAEPTAVFQSAWVSAGLLPGMGAAHHLPHIAGSAAAASMLLLGSPVDAESAQRIGLVNEVVDDHSGLAAARRMAAAAASLPAVAIARTKAALRRSIDGGLEDELARLGREQGGLLRGPDFRAVARRFGRWHQGE